MNVYTILNRTFLRFSFPLKLLRQMTCRLIFENFQKAAASPRHEARESVTDEGAGVEGGGGEDATADSASADKPGMFEEDSPAEESASAPPPLDEAAAGLAPSIPEGEIEQAAAPPLPPPHQSQEQELQTVEAEHGFAAPAAAAFGRPRPSSNTSKSFKPSPKPSPRLGE